MLHHLPSVYQRRRGKRKNSALDDLYPQGTTSTLRKLLMIGLVCIMVSVLILTVFLWKEESKEGIENGTLNEKGEMEPDEHNPMVKPKPKVVSVRNLPAKEKRNLPNMDGRTILVQISNYRDSNSCAKTIQSLFLNASNPARIYVAVFDEIAVNEEPCFETYCKLVKKCRARQIIAKRRDSRDARGASISRYFLEQMIVPEKHELCLAIGSKLKFTTNWDSGVEKEWEELENKQAILSIRPKSIDLLGQERVPTSLLQCTAKFDGKGDDRLIVFNDPIPIPKQTISVLQAQLSDLFRFGTCQHMIDVPADPYLPYLSSGNEYLTATRLWTSGYDIYAPRTDYAYQAYTPGHKMIPSGNKQSSHQVDTLEFQRLSRQRVRKILGLQVQAPTEETPYPMAKYGLGHQRTLQQWIEFSGIDPFAEYDRSTERQFIHCEPFTDMLM